MYGAYSRYECERLSIMDFSPHRGRNPLSQIDERADVKLVADTVVAGDAAAVVDTPGTTGASEATTDAPRPEVGTSFIFF